jgi:hypothetical protein
MFIKDEDLSGLPQALQARIAVNLFFPGGNFG